MIVHREHWRDSENNIRQGFRCVRIAGFILPLALLIFWHFGAGLFGSPFGDSGPVARHLLKQALAAVFVLWPAAWLEDVRTGLGTLLMASVTVISLNATVLLGTGTAGCDIPLPLMALSPLTGLGLTGLFVFLRPPGTQRPTRGFWHFSIVVLLAATAFAASESVRVWRQVIAARTLAEHGWMMKLDRGVDVPTEVWSGTNADLSQLQLLGRLTDLRELSLWKDDIADADLRHLLKLTRLERIDLRETGVTDECVPHLSSLTGLRYVHLEDTAVTPQAKRTLQRRLNADFVH